MFLPIGDSPNLPKTPWVTWILIGVNVAIHLALWPLEWQAASPTDPSTQAYVRVLAGEVGIRPQVVRAADVVRFRFGSKPRFPSLLDGLTSMFLHSGWLHLAGNMLFLWIFGDNVEHRLGRSRFLLAYLATGYAATFGDTLLRWGSAIPSVGASGAISGALGLYFAWFPHNRVRVWAFLFPFYIGTLELPARIVLGMFLVIDNILPWLFSGGQGGVSYGAHIGGFLAGWGLARWIDAGLTKTRPRAVPRQASVPPLEPEPVARPETRTLRQAFRAALDRGSVSDAADLLFRRGRAETRRGLEIDDKIALGRALEGLYEPRAALAAYQRALADHPAGPHRAQAHLGAARVLLRGLGSPKAAYQHLYAVLDEPADEATQSEARRILEEIRGGTRSVPRGPWVR